VDVQREDVDTLEPQYSCSAADSLKSSIQSESNWKAHLTESASLASELDAISGVSTSDSGWHSTWDHYYDNLSAKQCHAKTLPCNLDNREDCVTQDQANEVYRLGNWEYSYLWRDSSKSAQYSALKFGGWVLELKTHLQDIINGDSKVRALVLFPRSELMYLLS
jgi:2-phosphoxylose phosphatase